jgi:uncharacterized protein
MNRASSSLQPVGATERIHVLDALRGFAIFGIFVINIRVFTGYSYFSEEAKNQVLLADWNVLFDWFHNIFFLGKFYTLFSLLFGIGFAIQFIRASSADRSFVLHFSRRLFFLLLIGVVHLWGIWFSDILVIYALCGYLLIFFKDLSDRGLLWSAFLILLIPGIHAWYLHTTEGGYTNDLYLLLSEAWNSMELPKASSESETFQMRDLVEVIQSESWSTVLSFNYIGPLLRGYMISLDARLFKVLGIFLIGFWLGRHLMLHKIHQNKPFWIKTALAGFLIGLPLNLYFVLGNPSEAGDVWVAIAVDALTPFAYVFLTAGYVALFMLLYLTRLKKTLDVLFSDVGKTALTNYILQSVLGILLFYNVGAGLGEYMGSAALTGAVIVIFALQIVMSSIWLSIFKYGPLEWFWRVLTYGKWIKNRKQNRH